MTVGQARQVLTSRLPALGDVVTGRWPLLLRLVNKVLADYAQAAGAAVPGQAAVLWRRLAAGGPAVVDDTRRSDGGRGWTWGSPGSGRRPCGPRSRPAPACCPGTTRSGSPSCAYSLRTRSSRSAWQPAVGGDSGAGRAAGGADSGLRPAVGGRPAGTVRSAPPRPTSRRPGLPVPIGCARSWNAPRTCWPPPTRPNRSPTSSTAGSPPTRTGEHRSPPWQAPAPAPAGQPVAAARPGHPGTAPCLGRPHQYGAGGGSRVGR